MSVSTDVTRVFDWFWDGDRVTLYERGDALEVDVEGKVYPLAHLIIRNKIGRLERASQLFSKLDRLTLLKLCARSEVFRISERRVYIRCITRSVALPSVFLRFSEWFAGVTADHALWLEGVKPNGMAFRLKAQFEPLPDSEYGRVVLDHTPQRPLEKFATSRFLLPKRGRRLYKRLIGEGQESTLRFAHLDTEAQLYQTGISMSGQKEAIKYKEHCSNGLQLIIVPSLIRGFALYQIAESRISWAAKRAIRYGILSSSLQNNPSSLESIS